MPITAKGDRLKRLDHLLKHPDLVKQRLLTACAGEALSLVKRGFRTETDPSGVAWLPLKHRKGVILRLTGRLANSFTSRPLTAGFSVGTNVAYAKYQQEGTRGHSKAYSRKQAVSRHVEIDADTGETRTSQRFVRGSGRARVTVRLADDKVRVIKRANGKVISVNTKKVLKSRGVAGEITLNFRAGTGGIPARHMVPPNGELSPLWSTALDRVTDSTLKRIVREAGAK